MKKFFSKFAALAFIVSMIVPGVAQAQYAKPFVGTWEGAIEVPGQPIEIILEFALEGENLTGNVDVPAQGAEDVPLAEFKIDGKKITFMIDHPEVPGEPMFNGELDEASTTLAGTFSQGGGEIPFKVTKK